MEPERTASVLWVAAAYLYIYIRAFIHGCYAVAFVVCKQLISPNKWLFGCKRRLTPPERLQDPDLGKHGYVKANGVKFHYVEKGDRSRPLMLFAHGFPDFWYSWRHQMKEFSQDYWTVAVDMRGFGCSDKPTNVSDYDILVLVEDIKGIVTELGREKFTLVGHDWGAVVSWAFLDKYPEMVNNYILMNGPSLKVFTQLLISFTSNQSFKSWYTFLFQLPNVAEMYATFGDFLLLRELLMGHKKDNPYLTDDDIEVYKYSFSQPGAIPPPLMYYQAAYRRIIRQGLFPIDLEPNNESGPRPRGLFIFGAQDVALDVKCVNLLETTIENLDTLIIKEGSHFIHQDEPLAVHKAMRSFLK